MRFAVIFLLCIGVSSCVYEFKDLEPVPLTGAPEIFEIPFKLTTRKIEQIGSVRGTLELPCSVEDRVGNCTFDTGAEGFTVHRCFSASGWNLGNEKISGASGESGKSETRHISQITLGSFAFAHVIAQLSEIHGCKQSLALVGIDPFHRGLMLDFKRRVVAEDAAEIPMTEPLELFGRKMFIIVEFNGVKLRALVDTGAPITFIDARRFEMLTAGMLAKNQERVRFGDFTGRWLDVRRVVKAPLRVAGVTLPASLIGGLNLVPVSDLANFRIDAVLGVDALRNMRWGFDFKNRQWGLLPLNVSPEPPVVPNKKRRPKTTEPLPQ